jgi:TRAP-type mannitol/chloroaromatic compound transport system permease large subunit
MKNRSAKLLRIRVLIKNAMRTYTLLTYNKLLKLEFFQEIIFLLNKSGLMQEILNSYPKLQESKKAYEEFNNSIINSYLAYNK